MLPDFFQTRESLTITKPNQREMSIFWTALGDLLREIPQGQIVDCFTGASGLYLYPDDLRSRVVGVDRSVFQLRNLQSQLLVSETYPPKTIEALPGNFPFPDSSVAAVVAVRGVRYLEWDENRSFTTEAFRILQPGGPLIILDYSTVDIDEGFNHSVIRKLEKLFFDPTTYGRMIEALGFRDVKAQYNYLPELRMHLVSARK